MKFNSTRESGDTTSSVYWGTNFMTINVDNSDQPVNIDIRPGHIMQLNYQLKFKELLMQHTVMIKKYKRAKC